MFDAEPYIVEFQQLAHGQARLDAMRKAIAAADEAKDPLWQFRFRERYLNESIFESDDVDAMVIFPQMLSVFDANTQLSEDDECRQGLMWSFKLVIENALDFSGVAVSEIDRYFAEYEKRCALYGYSKRTALYLRESISEKTGRPIPAEECGLYRREPEDELKDCTACECSHDVRMALMHGQRERAEQLSQPIFSGELHCGEVPETTYAAWIAYDIRRGDYGHARTLGKRLYPLTKHRMDMLRENGILLRMLAKTDRELGTTVFRHELRDYLSCRNQWMRMHFAAGAYHLFRNMQMDTFSLILPQEFPLYNDKHRYESAALRDYFYAEAKELAEKFDARNGNTAMRDALFAEDPAFDGNAVDLIHGDTESVPSVIGAVCTELPEELTAESVTKAVEADARFKVMLSHAETEQGMLAFQIADGSGTEDIYQLMIVCQPVPPVKEFRPASPISDTVQEACEQAEGVVLFIMPFEEKQPDLALHVQLKLMQLICPSAVAFLDYSRMKLLPAGWVFLAAKSEVPPLVDYLYNLQLRAMPGSDALWITTQGLRCCGLRELEILDANKQNFARYCDLLCFLTERVLLRGILEDAKSPINVVRKRDGSSVVCTWVPASEAKADYGNADGWAVRAEMLGEEESDHDGNAVVYLYDGEAADGTPRRKRMNTLTDADFAQFCYGSYVMTQRKTAALAKENYPLFCELHKRAPENSYVCVEYKGDGDTDEIWVKVQSADEKEIRGTLAEDCAAGEEGAPYQASPEQLTDFSVMLGEGLTAHPNTAYIALDIA